MTFFFSFLTNIRLFQLFLISSTNFIYYGFCSTNSPIILEIEATYQAVENNIPTDLHPQCLAWKLWWRTESAQIDLSPEDIDLLTIRRTDVWIQDENSAEKYLVPVELLKNFTVIHINFKSVCRLLPKIVQIASPLTARRNRINLDSYCEFASFTENELSEITLESVEDAEKHRITVNPDLYRYHKAIRILMPFACNSSDVDEEEVSKQYYVEKYGEFSFNISNIKMNINELHDLVNDMKSLDNILHNISMCQRPLPSSTILPFLRRVKYDARQPPALHIEDKVTVKVGLLIQSISNFEMATMDYDFDSWIRMTWIDPRLRHGLSRPILVNDYTFLKMIWRPDPIFTNSKSSTFHKVSYLNFYLLIFPDGKIFMDIRVYLKPTAAQIVLCKYPHDNPAVSVKISSMGFTQDVVSFEWFTEHHDAIRYENEVKIPELSIHQTVPEKCNGIRKSGNYSCLEVKFLMHREIGYHIANTYIPTAICVVFSWISVWLPEEFVEGRIFVSLTVFLTLSAENNSAKEELPKVSYVKAIDIWFGFTSTFVFLTMLQALLVISLEHNSRRMKEKTEKNLEGYSKFQLTKSLLLSRYYHRVARQIDSFCKVMYPVTFLLFIMFYGFVITQGDEKKCITK